MVVEYRELCQVWAMRLSAITMIIVVLLSWLNELRILDLVIRAGVSFGVMYLLMVGSLRLFEKTSLQTDQNLPFDSETGPGGVIDFSVGDDDVEPQKLQVPDSRFPGQVDQNLSSGLPDSERQAEIVRRMGWD